MNNTIDLRLDLLLRKIYSNQLELTQSSTSAKPTANFAGCTISNCLVLSTVSKSLVQTCPKIVQNDGTIESSRRLRRTSYCSLLLAMNLPEMEYMFTSWLLSEEMLPMHSKNSLIDTLTQHLQDRQRSDVDGTGSGTRASASTSGYRYSRRKSCIEADAINYEIG